MNLGCSEQDRMIADSARTFLRARELGAKDDLAHRWRQLAELGWLGLPIPDQHGGLGAADSTLAVLMEQLGRVRATEPFAPTVVLGAGLLARLGGDYAANLLASISRGERILAVGMESMLVAEPSPSGWRLSGTVPLLVAGAVAQTYLLPAQDTHGVLRLFAIDRAAPGVTTYPVPSIDDSAVADVTLTQAPADAVSAHGVQDALAWAFERGTALACADAVGAITALIDATVAHTRSRTQFGRALAEFQVVAHQLADMYILKEEARAASQLAVSACGADGAFRRRAISAAKVKVGQAGRSVSHAAIQLHGAMGVTDELDVGFFVKRLMGFEATGGTRDVHLARYTAQLRSDGAALGYFAGSDSSAGPELSLDAAARRFRSEVRAFLEESLPPRIRGAQRLTTTVYAEADVAGEWHAILHRRGWSAPNWPAASGGPGWTATQRYIFAHEAGAACAPTTSPIGLPLVGPVLMRFGDDWQKRRYLPAIVSGQELWCQGFSEPGAGSDLAALATRAAREGNDYVVNGSKMWTTQAHAAQFMAALVRTGSPGGRRDGITFLIIDLRSPGIQVRPIVTIGGDHEVNQVFFDQVRVPMKNRVGGEGQGWEIAKFLLDFERGGDINSAGHRALLTEIKACASAQDLDDAAAFWRSMAEVAIDVDILEMLELRSLMGAADSPAVASMLKVRASEIQQSVTELTLRLLGRKALRWHPERPLCETQAASPQVAFTSRYLNSRATTIFGGAREIQKSIIARTVLT